jgi:hypothetical protein
MQRLSTYTNVIPVIAKSETLTAPELVSVKASVLARLQSTAIKPFLFGKPIDDALLAVQGLDIVYPLETPRTAIHLDEAKEANQFPFPTPTHPYAVSSVQGSDADVMEASLLMSPDYVQPLVPSELSNLIEQVFDPESIAWLRHAGAKKFLSWRRRTKLPGDSFILHGLQQPRSPTTASVGLAGTMGNRKSLSFASQKPCMLITPSLGNVLRLLRRLPVRRSRSTLYITFLLECPIASSFIHRRLPNRSYCLLPHALHQ